MATIEIMRRQTKKMKTRRIGNAGIVASFVIGFVGIAIGAFSAYVSEHGAAARANRAHIASMTLREPLFDQRTEDRTQIVSRVVSGRSLERLPAPLFTAQPRSAPKIIVIFDDVGLDRRAFEEITQLPGPVTLSFLPYAQNVEKLADIANEQGNAVMLHLPMEPMGDADPGPYALKTNMTGVDFISALDWNLARFDHYVGVNNHMGSKLTSDQPSMVTILAKIRERGLFFLDSVTTSNSAVRAAGNLVGATVYSRDVFIDPDPNDKSAIRRQLEIAEQIARETGYVIAICHPRPETLEVVGPWLTSAPMRGFELASVEALAELTAPKTKPLIAVVPELRG